MQITQIPWVRNLKELFYLIEYISRKLLEENFLLFCQPDPNQVLQYTWYLSNPCYRAKWTLIQSDCRIHSLISLEGINLWRRFFAQRDLSRKQSIKDYYPCLGGTIYTQACPFVRHAQSDSWILGSAKPLEEIS